MRRSRIDHESAFRWWWDWTAGTAGIAGAYRTDRTNRTHGAGWTNRTCGIERSHWTGGGNWACRIGSHGTEWTNWTCGIDRSHGTCKDRPELRTRWTNRPAGHC